MKRSVRNSRIETPCVKQAYVELLQARVPVVPGELGPALVEGRQQQLEEVLVEGPRRLERVERLQEAGLRLGERFDEFFDRRGRQVYSGKDGVRLSEGQVEDGFVFLMKRVYFFLVEDDQRVYVADQQVQFGARLLFAVLLDFAERADPAVHVFAVVEAAEVECFFGLEVEVVPRLEGGVVHRLDDQQLLALHLLDVLGLVLVVLELEQVEGVGVHPVRHVRFCYDLVVDFLAVHAEGF